MSACPAIATGDASGIANALRAVDCLSSRAAATAFSRLFGTGGALGLALTLLLTLYVGLLAVSLLTGRSTLRLSMLMPRTFALGLALTFATSWVAYQSVIWNLAAGAPDQIASVIVGSHGSATAAFANRLDAVFGAVADAAAAAQAAQTDNTPKAAGFRPADILWLGALLLLFGTVGVLVVARIALAALLAVGPIFVILSLFRGTRGLFEGWLKGVALFAITPLFAVLIGGGSLAMLAPVIASLNGGDIDMRTAVVVLLAAVVYCALMTIVLKVSVTVTSGWRLPDGGEPVATDRDRDAPAPAMGRFHQGGAVAALPANSAATATNDRVREIVANAGDRGGQGEPAMPGYTNTSDRTRSTANSAAAPGAPDPSASRANDRARGIGSQFRAVTSASEKLPC